MSPPLTVPKRKAASARSAPSTLPLSEDKGPRDMNEIGRLKPAAQASLARFTGYFETPEIRHSIRLEGDESVCDAQQPSHRIFARSRTGTDVQIGSAWLKTAKRGPRAGEQFLSLSIDYPGLAAALNVAAFLDRASGDWIIVWRRRGPRSVPELAA